MMSWRHSLKAAVIAAAFFIAGGFNPAAAGSFQVTPVRVEISAQQPVIALTVANNDSKPVVIQLQPVSWRQEDGNDFYEPTQDLIATPPIFTMQPGANQIVRLGLRRRPDSSSELPYRLYLQEVPPAPESGFRGLQMALRIGIPVFVQPENQAAPELLWKVEKAAAGKLKVTIRNQGRKHIQLSAFEIGLPGQEQPLAVQDPGCYLLPSQERSWTLPVESARNFNADTVHAAAHTDAGKLEADVRMDKP